VTRYRPGLKRLHKVFGDNVALLPSVETENVIVIASKEQLPSIDTPLMRAHAKTLTKTYKMPFDDWLKRMSFIRSVL
jgi:hypothetical protein